jgi:hypothetical protein
MYLYMVPSFFVTILQDIVLLEKCIIWLIVLPILRGCWFYRPTIRLWCFRTICMWARNRGGKGLSYRPARLHRLAGRYNNSVPSPDRLFIFVNLLRNPEIDSQPGEPVLLPYLTYRPARLHRLAESIPFFYGPLYYHSFLHFHNSLNILLSELQPQVRHG